MTEIAKKPMLKRGALGIVVHSTLGLWAERATILSCEARDIEQHRARVHAWARADHELSILRREDIRQSDAAGIRAVIPTADLLKRLGVELSPETGLVEQQAWFAKLRHRQPGS